MYETLPLWKTEHNPQEHELRVAVFSLSQRALIGSFSSPDLFKHLQPLKEDGSLGVTHEQRATTLFNGEYKRLGMPYLKVLGRIGSVSINENEDASYNICGIAVMTAGPYDFRKRGFQRYDIDGLAEQVEEEIEKPGSTNIDQIDAQLLSVALPKAQSRAARVGHL